MKHAHNYQAFGRQLTALRQALLNQIADQSGAPAGHVEVSADHFGHPEDSGAHLASERELELALGERELAELSAIDAALARIDAGIYGECTDCGAAIAPARLSATPQAPRCIQCQERLEHLHPH